MRGWSPKSQIVYDQLDSDMQLLVTRLRDEVADISLLCGFRDKLEQDAAFEAGTSQKKWPDGNHNKLPSKAVDFRPYPWPENELKVWAALGYIAGRAIAIAKEIGFTLRWGGDWDMDGDLTDQKFDDLFHLEKVNV